MIERIILCGVSCLPLAADLPYTQIGTLSTGAVLAVDDAALLRLFQPGLPLLYFSREAMTADLAGLSPAEQTVALVRRASRAPEMFAQMPEWLYQGERHCLALAAALRAVAPAAVADFIPATLALLADLVGSGRYTDLSLAELLIIAQERENRLLAELAEAPVAAGPTEVSERQRLAMALGRSLAAQGFAEYAAGPLVVSPVRGVLLTPRDARLARLLRAERLPFFPWRGGLVASLPASRLRSLIDLGYDARLLFHNGAEFLQAMDEQTEAQLAQTCERQAARAPATALAEHLQALRLEQLLFLQALAARVRDEPGDLATAIATALRTQRDGLLAALARDGIWQPPDTPAEVHSLAACVQAVIDDTALFRQLALASGEAAHAERLAHWLAALRRQQATLPAGKGG